MARVVLTTLADLDAGGIWNDLALRAGRLVASEYFDRFDRLYQRLESHPEIGAERPGLGRGLRIYVVRPYVVVYHHNAAADQVTVIRIVHGRRRMAGMELPDRHP